MVYNTLIINRSSAEDEQSIKSAILHIQYLFQWNFCFIGCKYICIKEHTSVIFPLLVITKIYHSLTEKELFKSDAYLWISSVSNIVPYFASFPYLIAKDIFIIQMKIEIFVCSTNMIFLHLSD